jgi:hypothetical protein
LLETESAKEGKPDVPWGWPKRNGNFKNLTYSEISELNANLLRYSALLDDAVELGALLEKANAKPWSGLDVDGAMKQIEKDIKKLCEKLRKPVEQTIATVRETGLLTISAALHDGLGLDWGGVYGDMMHFDARNLGRASKIQTQIQRFKKDDAAQETLSKRWEPFRGKSEETILSELKKAFPPKSG